MRVSSGVLGLLAYLALYVVFIVFVWKSDIRVSQKSILTGVIIGYAVHNIFVFDNLGSYVPFFALLGFAVMSRLSSQSSSEPVALFGNEPVSDDVVDYIVAPVVVVLLVGGLYFLNYQVIRANTGLIIALQQCQQGGSPDVALFKPVFEVNSYTANQEAREQLLSCAGSIIGGQAPNVTKQAFYQLASQEIDKQISATPKDARIYNLAGSFFSGVGQLERGISLLEKAAELSPGKQSIALELGNTYINAGKNEKAIEILKKTYESATDNLQAKTIYVSALIVNKQEDVAHQLFGNDPQVFQSDTLAQVYTSLKQYDKAIAIYRYQIANNKTTSPQLLSKLAQAQYAAGLIDDSIESLRSIEKAYPEYSDQIETTIKKLQAETAKK